MKKKRSLWSLHYMGMLYRVYAVGLGIAPKYR